ncbi:cytochrome P450 [Sungkyunkwania multivorans]|uniref:Cytochrome P450 n=1 Tax=Sungkyunkwania multivorans TaxID=1173618 RepID=A0ABW3D541_9FLAO
MKPIQIAKRSDIQTDQLHEVILNEQRILLLEHENSIKAFQGNCPHEGTPLIEGHIEKGHIVCPMHHWKFSCQDGKHTRKRACLKSYPIKIEDGNIFIDASLFEETPETITNKTKTLKDLPTPKGDFIVGHLHQFNVENKHRAIEKWSEEVGNIFRVHFVGKPFLVSTNPDFNKKVLKARPEKFRRLSKMTDIIEEIGVKGVFNAEGETWKKHRKLTSEALNMKNVKGFFPIISQTTERFLNKLKRLEATGDPIDIQQEMMRYTVDITTVIAFGYPMNTIDHDGDVIQEHLEKVFPMINERITAPIPLWRYLKLKKDKELDHAVAEIEATVNHFINEAKGRLENNPELKENPTNFLEALLVEQEKDKNFSDHAVYSNVFSLLMAGEDTTSNSVSWALYYLGQQPEMVKKIREEAFEIYGDGLFPPNNETLGKLKYTEAVAMEALRLKPVAPNMFHQANEDIEINGIHIEKDTSIIFQIQVSQTDEKYFAHGESFVPERWLKEGCPFSGPHSPDIIKVFGAGPRFCPGKNLAMHEMIMALSMICKNFDVALAVKPEEVREVFAFSMYPGNLYINLKEHSYQDTRSSILS